MPSLFTPEPGKTAVPLAAHRSVGPVERHVMRERHVRRAEVAVGTQRAERILQRVTAFHAEQGRDAAAALDALHVVGGAGQLEDVGVLFDDPAGDVELLELHAGVAGIGVITRDINRPELCADSSGSQPRNISMPSRARAEVVARRIHAGDCVLPDFPRQVVVAVEHGRPLQRPLGGTPMRGGRFLGIRLGGDEEQCRQNDRRCADKSESVFHGCGSEVECIIEICGCRRASGSG